MYFELSLKKKKNKKKIACFSPLKLNNDEVRFSKIIIIIIIIVGVIDSGMHVYIYIGPRPNPRT